MANILPLLAISFFLTGMSATPTTAHAETAGFVINHKNTDLTAIPDNWLNKAKAELHITYNHTSHGSQIITGMNALSQFPDYESKYLWINGTGNKKTALSLLDRGIRKPPDLSQDDRDSNKNGIADWAEQTALFLTKDKNQDGRPDKQDVNVIIWSWCNIQGSNIPLYLNSMEWLIKQFGKNGTKQRAGSHPVQFVFMTAHANGGGENDSSDAPNNQIRAHCLKNNRILFDFADIENYDPDGNYFLNKKIKDNLDYHSTTGNNNWADEYLKQHPESELYFLVKGKGTYKGCGQCAHSGGAGSDNTLNCILKGRAAWWLFARLAGWAGVSKGTP